MTNKKCYITTPIYYASGNIQIGNTYTTVAADALARFYRMSGADTYFLTGMDEHGQKIEIASKSSGLTPQEYVNMVSSKAKELWKVFDISNDDFICTSEKRHAEVVQKIFEQMLAQDDIYLGKYEGDYCVSCEAFYTKTQLGENNTCPECGKPTSVVAEESYFLRLSKYADQLLAYINEHPDFIQPESRKNEVVSFITSGLEDLCVSRTTFSWGIPVLSDPKHVVYVWIDALSNYISALGYSTNCDEKYQKYWVDNNNIFHLIGKDILRFHAVYWPIMLMAIKVPINFKLYVHGWILNRGLKMSKSLGNAVYPIPLIERYGSDAVRYYLAKELPLGNDGLFSYDRFVQRYNTDLANDLGNLTSRTIAMVNKYFDGEIKNFSISKNEIDIKYIMHLTQMIDEYFEEMSTFRIQNGLTKVWNIISNANKYIDETTPWVLAKDPERQEELANVVYTLVETLRIVSILIAPVLVETSQKMQEILGIDEAMTSFDLARWGYKFKNRVVNKVEPLFKRLDLNCELEHFEGEK